MTISISFLCFLIKIFEFLFSTQKNFQFWDISLFYLLSFLFFSSSLWDKVKQIKAKQSKAKAKQENAEKRGYNKDKTYMYHFFALLCFCFDLFLTFFLPLFFSRLFFFVLSPSSSHPPKGEEERTKGRRGQVKRGVTKRVRAKRAGAKREEKMAINQMEIT